MATDNEQPASRRRIIAIIALADLPMPQRISFVEDEANVYEQRPKVRLKFDRLADGVAWAEHYKVGYRTYINNGMTNLLEERIVESGWLVSLFAGDPVVDTPLDAAIRAELEQVR